MEIKTIIRVDQEIEITEALKIKLAERFGNNIEVIHYSKVIDQQLSYQQRMDSWHQAMLFILETLPLLESKRGATEEIRKHLNDCLSRKKDLKPNKSGEEYQDVLFQYKKSLLSALREYWWVPGQYNSSFSHETELLNKAEQYVIMSKGRDNLVTLSKLHSFSDEHYQFQIEEQLPPCTQETLKELECIKKTAITLTPQWFKDLSSVHPAQVFLHHLSSNESKSVRDLKVAVNNWQLKWQHIVQNTTASTLQENLNSIKNNEKAQFPAWYGNWSSAEQAGLKELLRKNVGLPHIEQSIQKFAALIDGWTKNKSNPVAELQSLQQLPFWYLELAEHEQLMLKAVLRKHPKTSDAVTFIPSRQREVLGLPNFGRSRIEVVDAGLQTIHKFPWQYRSSHMVPRDELGKSGGIAEEQSERNLERVLDYAEGNKIVYVQTLVSPVKMLSPTRLPDYALDQLRKKTLANKSPQWIDKQFFSTNHPLNYAKYTHYTSASDSGCNAILNHARKYQEEHSQIEQIKGLDTQRPELLLELAFRTKNFINQSSDWQAYSKLDLLVEEISSFIPNLSFDEIQSWVNEAIEDTKPKESYLWPELEESSTPKSKFKDLLCNYLSNNKKELEKCSELARFLAVRCYFAAKQSSDEAKFIKHVADMQHLIASYSETLNSKIGTATWADKDGRELCLASLGNLLVQEMNGLVDGTCVSGKDRKAIEIMHTNAIRLFRCKYGFWPRFNVNDSYRSNFVNIAAELYATGHQHVHAGQNAPGSDGLKTPSNYLPADICKKICELLGPSALTDDDRRATNNEVKNANTGTVAGKTALLPTTCCVVAASRLSPKNQQRFINELDLLLKKDELWQVRNLGSLFSAQPAGIIQLKKILKSNNDELVVLISKVYNVVEKRLAKETSRTENTAKLYNYIRELYNSENPDAIFEQQMSKFAALREVDLKNNYSYS